MGNRPTPSATRRLTGTHLERISKREAKFRKVSTVTVQPDVERDPFAKAFEHFARLDTPWP